LSVVLASTRHLHSFPTRRSSDLQFSRRVYLTRGTAPACQGRSMVPSSAGESRDRRAAVLVVDDDVSIRRMMIAALKRSNDYDFLDRKSTRLNSSHQIISYAVFCL